MLPHLSRLVVCHVRLVGVRNLVVQFVLLAETAISKLERFYSHTSVKAVFWANMLLALMRLRVLIVIKDITCQKKE